ncbi:hypothetical protein ACH5RR_039184 [Cinchona calisaya]|uniref:Uncharacterized protein n=1 Tax=Cinchona calisaya TaxID=153742 RepID=A0ABD2XXH1_9GENT
MGVPLMLRSVPSLSRGLGRALLVGRTHIADIIIKELEDNYPIDPSQTDSFRWATDRSGIVTKFGPNIIRLFGSSTRATVSSFIGKGTWKGPTGRRRTHPADIIMKELVDNFPIDPSRADSFRYAADRSGNFTVKSAIKLLKPAANPASWNRIVWFRKNIPKRLIDSFPRFRRILEAVWQLGTVFPTQKKTRR